MSLSSRGITWSIPFRAALGGLLGVFVLALLFIPGSTGSYARQKGQRKLNFYPSLHLKFLAGEKDKYFVARTGVVNMSGKPMTDVVMRQTFDKKFIPEYLGNDQRANLHMPEGFQESIEGNSYTTMLPELRIAEAAPLAVVLKYKGRPGEVTFAGVEVEYTQDGERIKEAGPDLKWDLSKYTKYSGTLRDYIKRYAKIDMEIPEGGDDWGFTDLAARVSGRVPTGPVEVEELATGRMRFSIEAGVAGDLRQILVMRRPYDPSRQLKANDEVRRFIMGTVRSLADFTLDVDEMSIRREKVGRYDAWVAETRWHDRIKDRLGEGPTRWYIFVDDDAENLYVISISAQGRGLGPGKADQPNESREQELMAELADIVSSIRVL